MTDFNKIFQNLWHTPENEVVELKEAKESFDIDDLGKYFSALSNEANLRGMDFGWLIFGVNDKKRLIVGTNFKRGEKALNKLKNDMSQHTTGNHKMFSNQRERFFPMPDYLIDKEKCEVTVVIYGKAIDERYTRLLKENRNLTLQECVWLDSVQKGRLLDKKSVDILRKRGLVEGRYPQVYVSERISRSTGQLGAYVKNRGLSRRYYKDMLISYLEKKIDGAKRQEIDEFLMPMLPNTITNPGSYIGNLLAELKVKEKKIMYLDNRWWIDEK